MGYSHQFSQSSLLIIARDNNSNYLFNVLTKAVTPVELQLTASLGTSFMPFADVEIMATASKQVVCIANLLNFVSTSTCHIRLGKMINLSSNAKHFGK